MEEMEEYFFWLVKHHGNGIADGFSQLIYHSELRAIDVQLKDIHRISQLNSTFGRSRGGFNSAIVVHDFKYYWMAKLHKTLSRSSNINTRVFRDIDEAFQWLGYKNLIEKKVTSHENDA